MKPPTSGTRVGFGQPKLTRVLHENLFQYPPRPSPTSADLTISARSMGPGSLGTTHVWSVGGTYQPAQSTERDNKLFAIRSSSPAHILFEEFIRTYVSMIHFVTRIYPHFKAPYLWDQSNVIKLHFKVVHELYILSNLRSIFFVYFTKFVLESFKETKFRCVHKSFA